MAATEDKLSMSLDAMIEKSSKSKGPGPRRIGAGGRGGGPKSSGAAGGRKSGSDVRARVLSVGAGRSGGTTKRSGAPKRTSGGSAGSFLRRDIEADLEERREDPNRPRIDTASMAKVRAALDGNGKWEHDLYEGPRRGKAGGARVRTESGFKLLITNLDFKVTDEDVQELFKEFGPVKRAGVVYDRSGRSEEQAEVVYLNRAHALAAVKKYNRVCLDGKPMHIELPSQPPPGGRVVEALSSGIRISRDGSGNGRTVTVGMVGSGNMRSAQGRRGDARRAPHRLGGRGRQAMEED